MFNAFILSLAIAGTMEIKTNIAQVPEQYVWQKAVCTECNGNNYTFTREDGNMYVVHVNEMHYVVGDKYNVRFRTKGTISPLDDTVEQISWR